RAVRNRGGRRRVDGTPRAARLRAARRRAGRGGNPGVHGSHGSVSKFARWLLAIVIVAFGVRVAYVAIAKGSTCHIVSDGKVIGSYPTDCAIGDQIFYNSEANTVARGKGFVEPLWAVSHPGQPAPPAADHPPLTVMVLTPVSWLLDHRPLSSIVHDPVDAHV